MLKTNIRGSSSNVVSESVVLESLRKRLWTVGVYKFDDARRAQSKETCDCSDDGSMVLMIGKKCLDL